MYIIVPLYNFIHAIFMITICRSKSWGSSVNIVGRLQAGQLGFSSARGRDFFLCHCIQTGSVAHPVACPVGSRISLPTGKAPGI